MKITNRGIYNIKKCTIDGSEIISEYKGEFREAKAEAKAHENEFFKERLGKDWQNEKKRKKLGVQFIAIIKL
jgi:hypothetical protein